MLPPSACKVYTPSRLATAMVDALDPCPQDTWLDPCVGPGAFISPLRERGVPKDRIVAIDIEPAPLAPSDAADIVAGTDFFAWCGSTDRRFSKIVANPPYVAIRKLHPNLQTSVVSFVSDSDKSFALRSNYWCAFLAACLRLLKERGSLAFVLPAAWEYALYATDVRRSVYQQFRTVEIHRCLAPLFPDVREGCVVLVAKDYGAKPAFTHSKQHATADALITALAETRAAPPRPEPSIACGVYAKSARFSDLFSVTIGCVTGDAGYFLLTETQRIKWNLPVEALRPVVSKARHLTAARVSRKEWLSLRRNDERVWLFSPDPKSLRLKAVREYIEYGEKVCNLDGYKLRHRQPWYRVPAVAPGIGFLSGMTKLGPWISFLSMRGLEATNTLYCINRLQPMGSEELSAWGLSLLSTPCREQFN